VIFAARGIALALTCFLLVYVCLSLLVIGGSGWLTRRRKKRLSRAAADLLFALRVLPLAASFLLTLGLMVPSFLLLEPRSSGEGVGAIPLILGFCCLVLFAIGGYKAASAQARTARLVSGWLRDSTVLTNGAAHIFRVRENAPALAVAGIRSPSVFISEAAAAILTGPELHAALRHEMAHARRQDNLKKLFFAFCPFPGMARLEEAWREAAEMAADEAAVADSGEALELASALVRLSRLTAVSASPELTTALLPSSAEMLRARVERLMAWQTLEKPASCRWYALAPALGMVIATAVLYTGALAQVHVVSEWLVR
jgi:hypothetical protein